MNSKGNNNSKFRAYIESLKDRIKKARKNIEKFNKPSLIKFLLLVTCYLITRKFWENLFVNNIYSIIYKDDLLTGILIFVFFSGIIIWCIYKAYKYYYFPLQYSLYFLIIFAIYFLLYRKSNSFDLFSFKGMGLENLYFFDSLFLLLVLVLVPIVNLFQIKKKNVIEKEVEDTLGRKEMIPDIIEKIDREGVLTSYVIGIVAPWGAGKTTFFNFIKEELERTEKNKYLIMDFNPWKIEKGRSKQQAFFDQLNIYLSKYTFNFAYKIKSYLKQINVSSSHIFPFISFSGSFGENNIEDSFKEIGNTIEKTGKKFVVFIDDLDRLDEDEIMEVFKIIRNTAEFKNVIYICAYDRRYLEYMLNKKIGESSRRFIEKIVNYEKNLPYIDSQILAKKIKEHWDIVKENELLILIDKNERQRFSPIFDEIITTFRDVERFAFYLLGKYRALKEEVYIPDYFNISLLFFKYETVMRAVYENREKIFKNSGGILSLEFSGNIDLGDSSKKKPPDYFKLKDDNEVDYYYIRKFLENNDSFFLDQGDKNIIIRGMEELFNKRREEKFQIENYPIENSGIGIINPNLLEVYFGNMLAENILTEKEFKNWILAEDYDKIKELIKNRIKDYPDIWNQFDKKLDEYYIGTKEAFERIVSIIIDINNHLIANEKISGFTFDWNKFLIHRSKELSKLYKNETEFQEFILRMFEPRDLDDSRISFWRSFRNYYVYHDKYIIPYNKLEEYFERILKDYIEKNGKVEKEVVDLNFIRKYSNIKKRRLSLSKKAQLLLQKYYLDNGAACLLEDKNDGNIEHIYLFDIKEEGIEYLNKFEDSPEKEVLIQQIEELE